MRAIIIDHYENPQNFIQNKEAFKHDQFATGNADSPSCIDNITAYVFVKDHIIEDIKFSGIGCAICTSSTDIMADLLIHKSTKQAIQIIDNYLAMIDKKPYDESKIDLLYLYENVNRQANRINCAKVGIKAIKQAILDYER